MERLRNVLPIGALAGVLLSAIAAPVGAADTKGTVAIVNGVPGQRIDVCINGAEIRSALRYGGAVVRNAVSTGEKVLKFFEQDPRTCKGDLLAKHDGITLSAGDDLTIVVTKKPTQVVIFDNTTPIFLGEIPPSGEPAAWGYLAYGHAADLGARFKQRVWIPGNELEANQLASVWEKGKSLGSPANPENIIQVRVTRAGDDRTIARVRWEVVVGRRVEWILVGTRPGNVRFVRIDRAVSQPSS